MSLSNFYADRKSFQDLRQTEDTNALAKQAGGYMASGDMTGARNALYRGGELDSGMKVQGQVDAERKREAEGVTRFTDGVQKLIDSGVDPQKAWEAGAHYAPQLGIDPAHIQKATPLFAQDPKGFLAFANSQAKKELQFFQTDRGILAGDKATGKVGMAYAMPGKPLELDPAKNYYMPDNGTAPAPDTAGAQGAPPTANPDATWKSMLQRESGGQPGVTGPQTRYGRAQGIAQVLPQTGQAMAQKLGIPWRPDLMTAKTPEAAAYQEKIGRAYYDEGLQKYGNDPNKAAMYYHGGPDEKLWGPKTRAYAAAVAPNALQGGAGGDELGKIPGYRMIQKGQAPQDDAPLEASTVDLLAGKYLNNGTLPPMGAGKTGTRNRAMILNRATAMAKTLGLDANDLVAGNMSVKAAGQALSKATTLRSQVEGSEQTVLRNADFALSLAPKGAGHTGVPVLNRWIQLGRKNVGGDPDVAAFDAALGTVADEYAKVMTTSSGTGGGATSDSARAEAKHRINAAMTPAQLKAVIGAMKVEMHNRVASMTEVEAGLKANIRNGGQPGGGQAQAATAPPAQVTPAPAAPRPGEVRRGFRFKGGDPAVQKNWAKVG